MDKKHAHYMRLGKHVKEIKSGKVFLLISDMTLDGNVTGVDTENAERYRLLVAWSRNWENNVPGFRERFSSSNDPESCYGSIEKCAEEAKQMERTLMAEEIEPANKVQFRSTSCRPKFEVRDLGNVLVNGEARQVVYLDDYHFMFMNGGCYHIDEFAEICEKNGTHLDLPQEEIQTQQWEHIQDATAFMFRKWKMGDDVGRKKTLDNFCMKKIVETPSLAEGLVTPHDWHDFVMHMAALSIVPPKA